MHVLLGEPPHRQLSFPPVNTAMTGVITWEVMGSETVA